MNAHPACASLLTLPMDIWEENILPWLCISKDFVPNVLLPLSTTCKALRTVLEPHIFSRVILRLPGTANGVPPAIRSSSSPVAESVEHLLNGAQRLASSPMSLHVKSLVITPALGERCPEVAPDLDKQRRTSHSEAMDLCTPLKPRFGHLRSLFLVEMTLQDGAIEIILSLATLESLALFTCDVPLGVRVVAGAHLSQLRAVNIEWPSGDGVLELMEVVLKTPIQDLRLVTSQRPSLVEVLSHNGPFLTVTTLHLQMLDILDPVAFAARQFPNVRSLCAWGGTAFDSTERFPLTPGALPYVIDFSGGLLRDAVEAADTCPLRRLKFRSNNHGKSLPVDKIEAMLRSRGGAKQSTLLTLDMWFIGAAAASFAELLDTVFKRAKHLEHLLLVLHPPLDGYSAEFIQAFHSKLLPPLLRSLKISIYGHRSNIKDEKHRALAFLRRMSQYEALEQVDLWCPDFSLFYNRDVFGPLSPGGCESQCKIRIMGET